MSNRKANNKLSPEDLELIAETTATKLEEKFDKLEILIRDCTRTVDFNKAKANILENVFKIDSTDQYSKRENIRIGNFLPSGNLTNAVVEMLNHMIAIPEEDVSSDSQSRSQFLFSQEESSSSSSPEEPPPALFTCKDISDCHFTTPKQGKKQVIVRFVSRQSIRTIYQNKKKLQRSTKPEYQSVFLMDDITPLRQRLKKVVANIPGVSKTFFRDGNVHCIYKNKHHKIVNPDDIFKQMGVEVTEDMLRDLKLENYT